MRAALWKSARKVRKAWYNKNHKVQGEIAKNPYEAQLLRAVGTLRCYTALIFYWKRTLCFIALVRPVHWRCPISATLNFNDILFNEFGCYLLVKILEKAVICCNFLITKYFRKYSFKLKFCYSFSHYSFAPPNLNFSENTYIFRDNYKIINKKL